VAASLVDDAIDVTIDGVPELLEAMVAKVLGLLKDTDVDIVLGCRRDQELESISVHIRICGFLYTETCR
jgi:hypothetical protein